MKLKHSLLIVLSLFAIAGCGLKGDLYEPTNEPVVVNEASETVMQDQQVEITSDIAVEDKALKDKEGLHYQPTESGTPQKYLLGPAVKPRDDSLSEITI